MEKAYLIKVIGNTLVAKRNLATFVPKNIITINRRIIRPNSVTDNLAVQKVPYFTVLKIQGIETVAVHIGKIREVTVVDDYAEKEIRTVPFNIPCKGICIVPLITTVQAATVNVTIKEKSI